MAWYPPTNWGSAHQWVQFIFDYLWYMLCLVCSPAYQRFAWEALKKSINGLINKINVSNIGIIVRELFKENIIRGRGVLARSIMQAQAASPTFTHVYAALVSIINSKVFNCSKLEWSKGTLTTFSLEECQVSKGYHFFYQFPQIGELILTRLIILFRRGFRRNNKDICFSATRFIAHLVNQLVVSSRLLSSSFYNQESSIER